MRFPLIEFPSSMFSWSRQGGLSASCEASTMENRHLQQIYDDACDVGFAIKSDKTGAVITVAMTRPVHRNDEDNELLYWEYSPTSESIRKVPACPGIPGLVLHD